MEVMYSLKVAASSSLSADVSVELPVRIVNFVSLDPPPLKNPITPTTRSWAKDQSAGIHSDSEAPAIARVRSMEAMRSPQHMTGAFVDPMANDSDSRYPGVQQLHPAPHHNQTLAPPDDSDAARAKRLQHQKSLDFINHAIRSATARRGGTRPSSANGPSPQGLGIDVDENRTPTADSTSEVSSSSAATGPMDPSCLPYEHEHNPQIAIHGPRHQPFVPPRAVTLDEIGDDFDDEDMGEQTLNLNDESVADIDYVIESAHLDGGESSPEFQKRTFDPPPGDDSSFVSSSEDGDVSTDTVTSNGVAIREEDEYDEEEERLAMLQKQQHASTLVVTNGDIDDGPTPLAKSPPKFQSTSRPSGIPRKASASPVESGYTSSASTSSYTSSNASSLQTESARQEALSEGKTIVRTRSDLESQLGRSSTIIRGPSGNRSRPVSPSKKAPSPTKSALKGKSSFTFATDEKPLKQAQSKSDLRSSANASQNKGQPPALRAKVHPSQLPRVAESKARSAKRVNVPAESETEFSSSDAATSPASSSAISTPPDVPRELDAPHEKAVRNDRSREGLGIQMNPVVHEISIETPPKQLQRSTSKHNLRGSEVVVPSVRDKIAALESRKKALKQFAGSQSPGDSKGMGEAQDTTPSRVQAARNFLERNNSILSDHSVASSTASGPEYLKHTTSIASFKAPLFHGANPHS